MRKSLYKVRCIACYSTSIKITKEHFWPLWLQKMAKSKATFLWRNGNKISPKKGTIPMCGSCNNTFGTKLESIVQNAFLDLRRGEGLSEYQCEAIIRWLWKFEGLNWKLSNPEHDYSISYSLKERVLGAGFNQVRNIIGLAIGVCPLNESEHDLPIGLCSGSSFIDAICVSGVFLEYSVIVYLNQFSKEIPNTYSKFEFEGICDDEERKCFFPKTQFSNYDQLILTTRHVSKNLKISHEMFAIASQSERNILIPSRRKVEFPDNYK